MLAQAVPDGDPRLLSLWYGLDGHGARSAKTIAAELGMMTATVLIAHRAQLEYFQGGDGRMTLENAVLMAARETQEYYNTEGFG